MKSLNKKIGAMVLAGMVLVGSGFVASKAYASDIDPFNELVYYYNHKFDVIDDNHGDEDSDNIEKDVEDFGGSYGVRSSREVKDIDYNKFEQKVKNGSISKGMYFFRYKGQKVLVGVK